MEYIHIFKTNITNEEDHSKIKPILDVHPEVNEWNVDFADVDKVLRIRTSSLTENEIIKLITGLGFTCRELV